MVTLVDNTVPVPFLRKDPLQEGRCQYWQIECNCISDKCSEGNNVRWENQIGGLNCYQFNLLLEKQNLSCNLKDRWELPQCLLTVILASPLLTGRTCSWKISFADACQGWEECVSTVSATLWLPCQNPTEAAVAQGKQQDQDGVPTSEKKKKELFVMYRSRLPFRAWKALLLVWPDLFLWSSSDLLIKHWAWQVGKQKDGQRTMCRGLKSRSASPCWAVASSEAEGLRAAPRTRKHLEEHLPWSSVSFFFPLKDYSLLLFYSKCIFMSPWVDTKCYWPRHH